MAKKTTQKRSMITLAASVAKKLSIRQVQLVDCEAKHSLRGGKLPPQTKIQVNCNSVYDGEKKAVIVDLDFALDAYYRDSSPDDSSLQIRAKYLLLYMMKKVEKFTPEQLGAFTHVSATSHAWPYWGEFIQSMTTRMGLPPLTIAPFSFSNIEAIETKPAKKKASHSKPQSTTRKKAASERKRT